jgi:enterochelin esterase-like enzyme
MLALVMAAMVSLSQAERDSDFDKPPMNTLHDCSATPEPYGDCRLPPGLTAQDIQARLAGKRMAWWREGDQFVVVARRDTDQAYLCCTARGRMDHIADDLWALRLRIIDLDHAVINVVVEPQEDKPYETYYGPLAIKPVVVDKLQGRVDILDVKSSFLNESRHIFVYTPPGFDPAKKYPVVYMADGQIRGNTPGMIEPLILKGDLPPMILVAIWFGLPPDGSDVRRSQEYLMDWPDATDAFLNHQGFVLKEVMPYVEQHYGASTDPKARVITGFSSGAAWAVAMGLLHPDIFHNVIAQSLIWDGPAQTGGSLSASMGGSRGSISFTPEGSSIDVFRRPLEKSNTTRFYLSAGTLEPYFYRATMHFADEARETGHIVQFKSLVSGHFEVAWRQDLLDGLKWAFGTPSTKTQH